MTWQEIHDRDEAVERFRRILFTGRLASSFLFVGVAGSGKRTFAIKLAQAMLCETNPEADMNPCGHCPACQQVEAGSHPDLELVTKPKDKSFLPVELFIGDRDHRMRAGLCHNIALKPYYGGRKIAIIDDADYLNAEGANCLLKTLEEPPPNSVIILIGSSEQRQLPTIRSRCQTVRFPPLSHETVASLLISQERVATADEARRLADLGRGSLQRSLQFADPELMDFREEFVARLASLPKQSVGLAADIGSFVDAAGKDAPSRRERLKLVIEIAIDFYRELVRSRNNIQSAPDSVLADAVNVASRSGHMDTELIAGCIERCIEAHAQVDANANQATLIECWVDDLASFNDRVSA
jgi:DNA polymerase-3 subunit delta'